MLILLRSTSCNNVGNMVINTLEHLLEQTIAPGDSFIKIGYSSSVRFEQLGRIQKILRGSF